MASVTSQMDDEKPASQQQNAGITRLTPVAETSIFGRHQPIVMRQDLSPGCGATGSNPHERVATRPLLQRSIRPEAPSENLKGRRLAHRSWLRSVLSPH